MLPTIGYHTRNSLRSSISTNSQKQPMLANRTSDEDVTTPKTTTIFESSNNDKKKKKNKNHNSDKSLHSNDSTSSGFDGQGSTKHTTMFKPKHSPINDRDQLKTHISITDTKGIIYRNDIFRYINIIHVQMETMEFH